MRPVANRIEWHRHHLTPHRHTQSSPQRRAKRCLLMPERTLRRSRGLLMTYFAISAGQYRHPCGTGATYTGTFSEGGKMLIGGWRPDEGREHRGQHLRCDHDSRGGREITTGWRATDTSKRCHPSEVLCPSLSKITSNGVHLLDPVQVFWHFTLKDTGTV
jgi:hypothetical protein